MPIASAAAQANGGMPGLRAHELDIGSRPSVVISDPLLIGVEPSFVCRWSRSTTHPRADHGRDGAEGCGGDPLNIRYMDCEAIQEHIDNPATTEPGSTCAVRR
jgi:hypothetical protein